MVSGSWDVEGNRVRGVEAGEVIGDATSAPWVKLTIKPDDVAGESKVFLWVSSSEVVKSKVILWSKSKSLIAEVVVGNVVPVLPSEA